MERERAALNALRGLNTKFEALEREQLELSRGGTPTVNFDPVVRPREAQLRQPLVDARKALVPLVDRFWLRALVTHPDTFRLIMRDDIEPLAYLEHIEVVYGSDRNESAITKNSFLDTASRGDADGRYMEVRFEFSENEWFEDRVLYKRIIVRDGMRCVESSGIAWRNAAVRLTEDNEVSFFRWFEQSGDYHGLAQIIAERVFPTALRYYLLSVNA